MVVETVEETTEMRDLMIGAMEVEIHTQVETATEVVLEIEIFLTVTGVMVVAETVDSGMVAMIEEMTMVGMTALQHEMEGGIQDVETLLEGVVTPTIVIAEMVVEALVEGTTTGVITTEMNHGVGGTNLSACPKL